MQPAFNRNEALNIARTCVSFNIRKTARRVGQLYDRAFAGLGLKSTQFSVLMSAAINQKMPLSRLAAVLGMDRSTLSRNARLLAGNGYLRLENGEDRREQLLVLTDEGWKLLDRALPIWRQTQAQLEEEFGGAWLEGLLGQLSEINRRLP